MAIERDGKIITDSFQAEDPIFLMPNDMGYLKKYAIKQATKKQIGALRLATQEEVNNGTLDNVAVSPLTLKNSQKFQIITSDSTLQMNNRYIIKNSESKYLQLYLPEKNKIQLGDWIEIKNMGKTYQLNSGDGVDILINGSPTKTKNGYIRSLKLGDFIKLECVDDSSNILLAEMCTIGTFLKV